MITIRSACDADLPALVEVIQAAFAEYYDRLDPPSSAHHKTIESTRQELADGGAFVALDAEALIGCVFYHPAADHVYLDRLAVLPTYRRRGLAGRLLAAVEAYAHAQHLPNVRLSVRLALSENQAYYQRQGYRFWSYGTHTGYTTPTYVILQKQLAE